MRVLAPLNQTNSRPMKLTGNTLVLAGQSSTSSSPTAPTCSPDRIRPSRTTRGRCGSRRAAEGGRGRTCPISGRDLAWKWQRPAKVSCARPSARSQTQPDGGGIVSPRGVLDMPNEGPTLPCMATLHTQAPPLPPTHAAVHWLDERYDPNNADRSVLGTRKRRFRLLVCRRKRKTQKYCCGCFSLISNLDWKEPLHSLRIVSTYTTSRLDHANCRVCSVFCSRLMKLHIVT
jgi:hypothetical protein